MIRLRDYQENSLNAILAAAERGIDRQMLVLATGTGKTIVFAALIDRLNLKTLILVHRDELARQTCDKIHMINPALDVGIVKAEQNEVDKPIVVASIQTVQREERLAPLLPRALIIADEAHHLSPPTKKEPQGNSWYRVFERCMGDCYFALGCTATPYRPNNSPLIGPAPLPFREAVYTMGIAEGIYQGYLCGIESKHITLQNLNLDGIRRVGGDWTDGALDKALIAAQAPAHLLEAWKQHAEGRRTLIYTPGVLMAEQVAQTFNEGGISTQVVIGTTPVEKRQQIFKLWRGGQIQCVVNVAVLSEGFDEPSVDCIMIARPTTSRVLFQQCVGRGLRTYPGKENCLILDLVGATQRHQLMSVAHITGLAKVAEETEADDAASSESRRTRAGGEGNGLQGLPGGAPAGRLAVTSQEVNLYRKSPLRWFETQKGHHVLELQGAFLELRPCDRGGELWAAVHRTQHDETQLVQHVPLEMAQGVAEDTARDMGDSRLLKRSADWLELPPTEKQIAYAARLGVPPSERFTTRGEISAAIAEAKLRWWDICLDIPDALEGLAGLVRGSFETKFVRAHQERIVNGYWCSKKERRILARMLRELLHNHELAGRIEG